MMFVSKRRLGATKSEGFQRACQMITASAANQQMPYEILVARLRIHTTTVLLRCQALWHVERFIKRNHVEVDRIWKSAIGGDLIRELDASPAAVACRLAGISQPQIPAGIAAPHLLDTPVESPKVCDWKEGIDFQAI